MSLLGDKKNMENIRKNIKNSESDVMGMRREKYFSIMCVYGFSRSPFSLFFFSIFQASGYNSRTRLSVCLTWVCLSINLSLYFPLKNYSTKVELVLFSFPAPLIHWFLIGISKHDVVSLDETDCIQY